MAYNSLQNKFKTIEEKIDKTDPLQVSAYPKNSSIQHLSVQRAELKSEIEVLKDDQYRLENSPEYLKHLIQEIKLDIKRLKKQKKRLQKESKGFFLDRYLNRIKKKQRLFLAEKKELETIVSELEKDYKSLASD